MTIRREAWLYPWDIHDLETPDLAAMLQSAGIQAVHVAASYHSLFATIPDNPRRHFIELPASAIYFRPSVDVWEGATITPAVSSLVDQVGDSLDMARQLADASGSQASAWTVCLHDSNIGVRLPDLAIETLWGERIRSALCIRHPLVRDYALRLVRDVSSRSDRVQLESPYWTTLPHHRHVKVPVEQPDFVAGLASLCFCVHCREAAVAAGINLPTLIQRLRSQWDAAHRQGHPVPDLASEDDSLAEYHRVRAAAVTGLIRDLVSTSTAPVEVVSFGDRQLTGVALDEIEQVGASVRVLTYGSADQVAGKLGDLAAAPDRPRALQVGLSMLPEHAADVADLTQSVGHAVAAGAESVAFYHLGLVGADRRGWLAELARHARAGGRDAVAR